MQIDILEDGPICYLRLSGAIDASLAATDFDTAIVGGDAVMNLRGINAVNSQGAQQWREVITALANRLDRLVWVECSQAVVDQLNASSDFAGFAQVASVRATYFCENCGTQTDEIIDLSNSDEAVRAFRCASCEHLLAPQEPPAELLAFKAHLGETQLEKDMLDVIQRIEQRESAPTGPDQTKLMDRGARSGVVPPPKVPAAETVSPNEPTKKNRVPDDLAEEEFATGDLADVSEKEIEDQDFADVPDDDFAMADDDVPPPKDDATDPSLQAKRRRTTRSRVPSQARLFLRSVGGGVSDAWESTSVKQRKIGASVLAGLILVIFLLAAPWRAPSIDIENFLAFHSHLNDGQFTEASEIAVRIAEDSGSEEVATTLNGLVTAQRESMITRDTAKVDALVKKKRFSEALPVAKRVLEMNPTADSLFTVAECLRKIGDIQEAASYYRDFSNRYGEDRRLDNSLFWQAEAKREQNELGEAKALYQQVLNLPQSNFKRSAGRRLGEIQ